MKRKGLWLGLMLLVAMGALVAEPLTVRETKESALEHQLTKPDDIMLCNLPIAYGEEQFKQRILARTGGKRDPIGLVLSGGSARAMAHIGVLRYLEEQGIVPDYIVSNSMGSIVGMLYSAGMSPDQIEDMIKRIDIGTTVDLTLPLRGGLLETETLSALFSGTLGANLQLEDLPIPILVVTEDLVTKRQILVCEGDFSKVFRASFAIPFYFSPESYKGHLLIDGGVTNLAPIEVAYRYSDHVIVSTTFQSLDTLNLRNPLTNLNVAMDINKRRNGVSQMEEHPDMIWLRCQVEQTSFMDFEALGEISRKGYEAAQLQNAALGQLPQGMSVDALKESREALSLSIDTSLEHYYLFNHVRHPEFTQIVGPQFNSFFADEQATLKSSDSFGLAYQSRWGDFSFLAHGGFNWRSRTNADMSISPAALVRLDYFLRHHLRFTFLVDFDWDSYSWLSTFYFRQGIEGRWNFFKDQLGVKLLETLEVLSADDVESYDDTVLLLSLGASATYSTSRGDLAGFLDATNGGMAFQVYGDGSTARPFLQMDMNLHLDHIPHDFFFTAENRLRFAMDGEGNVPLFPSDGYRTADSDLLKQGHDPSLKGKGKDALYSGRFTFGWRPSDFKPSMAELLILKGSSVATYLDLLAVDSDVYVSCGLQLQTAPSLLGMKRLPMTTYVGYDSADNGIVWGFYFSSVLE